MVASTIIALRLWRFAGVLASALAHDVFFLKMRKAGSTSMLELLTAAAEHSACANASGAGAPRGVRALDGHVKAHRDWVALNERCAIRLAPRAADAPRADLVGLALRARPRLVTHLREPLGRVVSEFYFVGGPGGKIRAPAPEALDGLWARWTGARAFAGAVVPGARINPWWGAPGLATTPFVPDYFVRMLTGRCGECRVQPGPRDRRGVLGCSLFFLDSRGVLANPPSAAAGVAPYNRTLTAADLARARATLEAFDAVVIVDLLEGGVGQRQFEWLARAVLGCDVAAASLPQLEHKNVGERKQTTQPPSAPVLERLRALNRYDIELYASARERTRAAIAAFYGDSPEEPRPG